MTEPTPTRSFSDLSAPLVQKVDITDAFAMARVLLHSESRSAAHNIINQAALSGSEPAAVLRQSDNSAPALQVPSNTTPAQTVNSLMEQLQARVTGSGERRMVWAVGDQEQYGELKISRGKVEPALFEQQMKAVEHLRESLRNLSSSMLTPDKIDVLSSLPAAGKEQAIGRYFASQFTDIVGEYKNNISVATQGGFETSKVGVEYRPPVTPQGEPSLMAQAVERSAGIIDTMATLVAVQAIQPATSQRPAVIRPQ